MEVTAHILVIWLLHPGFVAPTGSTCVTVLFQFPEIQWKKVFAAKLPTGNIGACMVYSIYTLKFGLHAHMSLTFLCSVHTRLCSFPHSSLRLTLNPPPTSNPKSLNSPSISSPNSPHTSTPDSPNSPLPSNQTAPYAPAELSP